MNTSEIPLILDPALFMETITVPSQYHSRGAREIERDLSDVILTIEELNGYIPKDPLWENIEIQLLAPLLSRYNNISGITRPISAIRRRLRQTRIIKSSKLTVWGFRDLFECLGSNWTDLAVSSAANLIANGAATPFIVVSKVLGRNLIRHGNPPGGLEEKCIWNLRISSQNRIERMHCVANVRNIKVPWTCRYDDRLPAQQDNASFPFCAPANWHVAKPDPCGRAVRIGAHSGSEDITGRRWTRPSGDQGLDHWDVQIPVEQRKRIGNHYLNVTIGWPIRQHSKQPGTIDHGHNPPIAGWSC